MKPFITEDFLLYSPTAVELYNACKDLPIIDYHCHFKPKDFAENKRFEDVTEIVLGDDHYKWRLMRANGVDEKYVTGNGSGREKFRHWCATVEDCIGSPLYHWTHMEMLRYFGYDGIVNRKNADEIFDHANAIIARDNFNVWEILRKFKIEYIGTTDNPLDDLAYHKIMAGHSATDPTLPQVRPSFRPGVGIGGKWFAEYMQKFAEVSGVAIKNWDDLLLAFSRRIDYFHENGCRISDHGLDNLGYEENGNPDTILKKALAGDTLTTQERQRFSTALMVELAKMYKQKGWVMQLRMGGQGNNNHRLATLYGSGSGFAAPSDAPFSVPLSKLLNAMDLHDNLPKTILYGLNPVSDVMLSVLIGCFQDGKTPGKVQWGCPWWFNDNKTGIENHLVALGNNGVLARFIGMLTDARSFTSYPRHEYFRRVMANTIASWVEAGEFPRDMDKLREIVEGIAYRNAKGYFNV